MKKLMLTICLVLGLVIMAAPQVQALTVTVSRIAGYYSGSGGEFNITPSSWVGITGYDASTLVGSGFESFCIETNEYISMGPTYTAFFNSKAIMGGNPPNGDPISIGTAWLYHEFQIQGDFDTLATYNYDTAGGARAASAGQLQAAIWWLEGEAGDPGAGNVFRNAVITKFLTAANAMSDNNGAYPVAALNLYTSSGSLAQDMLVCVPVPEPGILILLGIALSAVGLSSRRFKF
jgi:hypothetical protein